MLQLRKNIKILCNEKSGLQREKPEVVLHTHTALLVFEYMGLLSRVFEPGKGSEEISTAIFQYLKGTCKQD